MIRSVVAVMLLTACGCGSKKQPGRDDAGATSGSGSGVAKMIDAKCVAGDQEACRSLAIMYAEGAGVPEDKGRAAALLGQACKANNLAACNQLALALAEGLGVAKDPAQAVAIYQRACDAGYKLACRNLGLMVRDGRGVPVDLSRAYALLDAACQGHAPFACTNAGDLAATRAKAAPDAGASEPHYQAMLAHYRTGCDDGDPTSCRNIGVAYLQGGKGLPKSTAASSVWLDRACKLDDVVACRVLGAMHVQGIGVAQDPAVGRTLLAKACDRKDAEACAALTKLAGSAGSAAPVK